MNHGYTGDLTVAEVTSEDERIFVLERDDFVAITEMNVLTTALQQVLGRKVWIVAASPSWKDTKPF